MAWALVGRHHLHREVSWVQCWNITAMVDLLLTIKYEKTTELMINFMRQQPVITRLWRLFLGVKQPDCLLKRHLRECSDQLHLYLIWQLLGPPIGRHKLARTRVKDHWVPSSIRPRHCAHVRSQQSLDHIHTHSMDCSPWTDKLQKLHTTGQHMWMHSFFIVFWHHLWPLLDI